MPTLHVFASSDPEPSNVDFNAMTPGSTVATIITTSSQNYTDVGDFTFKVIETASTYSFWQNCIVGDVIKVKRLQEAGQYETDKQDTAQIVHKHFEFSNFASYITVELSNSTVKGWFVETPSGSQLTVTLTIKNISPRAFTATQNRDGYVKIDLPFACNIKKATLKNYHLLNMETNMLNNVGTNKQWDQIDNHPFYILDIPELQGSYQTVSNNDMVAGKFCVLSTVNENAATGLKASSLHAHCSDVNISHTMSKTTNCRNIHFRLLTPEGQLAKMHKALLFLVLEYENSQ